MKRLLVAASLMATLCVAVRAQSFNGSFDFHWSEEPQGNALDAALRIEQPSEADVQELILLAKATVPEGSVSLPAQ